MSISSTRKVSGSHSSPARSEYTRRGGEGESFVEVVDTTNNVWINDDAGEQHHNQQETTFKQKKENKSQKNISSTGRTYIPNAIEALTASGVYDDEHAEKRPNGNNKIGIYDNNQSIITEEKNEQYAHRYLKHFYERNEIIQEVDELV